MGDDEGRTMGPLRRRTLNRLLIVFGLALVYKLFFAGDSSRSDDQTPEIRRQGVFELVSGGEKALDVHQYDFLQVRMGRDEDRDDMFSGLVSNGVQDYWERFQKPRILNKDTSLVDQQNVMAAIESLLSLNGWVAGLCPTLSRPFGQNKFHQDYSELSADGRLFYVSIAIHSADHFLVDQLAVIVQIAKRLGVQNVFVSMLDYGSTDSTETLTDLCEAVMILLGVPFRIRRVPPMTEDPAAAYYPLEEVHMRNMALEPLHELYQKRKIKFHRVIWLKGFTCPYDILESIKVSVSNDAAMVCGMDWAELNGFYIFSDRWRTRDMNGDQFRQSKSSSNPDASPPRDKVGASRYVQHLPFQVFCCESGTHIVDPNQSYYRGIIYRAGNSFHNTSEPDPAPARDANSPCLDSAQAWFCRDLWVDAAREGIKAIEEEERKNAHPHPKPNNKGKKMKKKGDKSKEKVKREEAVGDENEGGDDIDPKKVDEKLAEAAAGSQDDTEEDSLEGHKFEDVNKLDEENVPVGVEGKPADVEKEKEQPAVEEKKEGEKKEGGAGVEDLGDSRRGGANPVDGPIDDGKRVNGQPGLDPDANAGSDYDAMPETEDDGEQWDESFERLSIPNSEFRPARILVNPRCVTTYAGVSHTDLALDLFGPDKEAIVPEGEKKYVLDDWVGAPESFVCQEQRQTGGRKATKTQRRLGFSVHGILDATLG